MIGVVVQPVNASYRNMAFPSNLSVLPLHKKRIIKNTTSISLIFSRPHLICWRVSSFIYFFKAMLIFCTSSSAVLSYQENTNTQWKFTHSSWYSRYLEGELRWVRGDFFEWPLQWKCGFLRTRPDSDLWEHEHRGELRPGSSSTRWRGVANRKESVLMITLLSSSTIRCGSSPSPSSRIWRNLRFHCKTHTGKYTFHYWHPQGLYR